MNKATKINNIPVVHNLKNRIFILSKYNVLTWLFLSCFTLLILTSFTKKIPEMGVKIVVIDPGHGGHDVGCLGSSSKEKEIALSISLKLGKFIEDNFKDVKVIYTRKTDVFVELHERAKIANDNNADLFICVHANANNNKDAYGSETFIMGLHKSDANLNVAKRENSSILMEENYEIKYEGFDLNSDESYIALSLMQSAFLENSANFAHKIQTEFEKIGRKNRGVKQAGFLVLYRTTMPSVLIETGFLTNKEEEKYLMQETNQITVANAIFEAFSSYKKEVDKRFTPTVNNTNNTTINETVIKNNESVEENSLVYRVQVVSSSKRIPLQAKNFNGFDVLFEYEANGLYKYAVGASKNMEEIAKTQSLAKEKGYNDAFVVAFYNNKRISMSEAKELENK
jgi:N-acetylmuramoyl-L-alanine amidase